MPAPLDPTVRAAIEQDVRTGGKSRNAIARAHNVSGATVSKIANALEQNTEHPLPGPAFDRSQTKRATADRAVDLADRRVRLASLALDDAEAIRARMWEPYTTMTGKGDDAHPVTLEPAPKDIKELAIAFGIMVDKSRTLEGDTDNPVEQAAGAVSSLLAGLRAQRAAEQGAA